MHVCAYTQLRTFGKSRFTNMAAEIDIDALKIFERSRTNKAENRQKIENSQSQTKIYRF